MRSYRALFVAGLLCGLGAVYPKPHAAIAGTDDPPAATESKLTPPVREICVPYDDLGPLLESQSQCVLLSRAEYADLLRRAERAPVVAIPHLVMPIAADYLATVMDERAEITGTLVFEVLAPGVHVVDLDLAGAGLRHASLDGRAAPLARSERGTLRVFLNDIGRHELTLDLVAPLETTAALQTLKFHGPTAPATRMRVRVPGNVDVKGGAPVVHRTFDADAQVTEFEILPPPGPLALAMTLNNRLQQSQRVVLARSVLLDEVTAAYERLHATVTMSVLQQPVDRFRLALPSGLELTSVDTPLLSQWATMADGPRRVLEVRLREPTTGAVRLTIAGVRTPVDLAQWSFPRLEPLDVLGDVAVAGVLLEERLKLQQLEAPQLVPVDVGALGAALPPAALAAGTGAPALRPVAAFYAPAGAAALDVRARFERPTAGLSVASSLWLTLSERELQLRGEFTLQSENEQLFGAELDLPAAWHVTSVLDADNNPLRFELVPIAERAGQRMRVFLPQGVPPGGSAKLCVAAVHTPDGWLADWQTTAAVFPALAIHGATQETGALVVQPGEDLAAYVDSLEGLLPLDENEKPRYGLTAVPAASGVLAYSFDSPAYRATFRIERVMPRLTARSYAFLRLAPNVLTAHYELAYDVAAARARQLVFVLPATTPADITIRGLDGLELKEFEGTVVGDARRWTVLLAAPLKEPLRLAVEFEQRVGDADTFDLDLPVARAADVAYQSGVIAVESSAELDVAVETHPRKVDVGELAPADFQPTGAGAGGLGVFGFVGDEGAVKVHVARRASYALPVATVQHADLTSSLSADGICQTAAVFALRLKTDYLDVELPAGATLWSVEVDGQPARPQREGGRLLLSMGGSAAVLRELRIVYELPVGTAGFWREVDVPALRLYVPGDAPQAPPREVPVADLAWHLNLPGGYAAVRQAGTVRSTDVQPPEPAAWKVARALYRAAGGVHFFYGGLLPSLASARSVAKRGRAYSGAEEYSVTLDREGVLLEPATAGRELPGKPAAATPAAQDRAVESKAGAARGVAPKDAVAGGEAGQSTKSAAWALDGVRSLKIDVEATDQVLTFASLGGDPRLVVTLAARRRVAALAWTLVLLVVLIGLALINRRTRTKAFWIVFVILAATLVPLLSGRPELAHITNRVFCAACLLVPVYLLAALLRWLWRNAQRPVWETTRAATVGLLLLCGLTVPGVRADEPAKGTSATLASPQHLKVPADALIVPYEPNAPFSPSGPRGGFDQLLVPYGRFIELWNLAYPDKRIETAPPPASYALAGASYAARLADDGSVTLEGQLDIDVFAAGYVTIPLRLAGGVLAQATLDGAAAPLSVTEADPSLSATQPVTTAPQPAPVLLGVQGVGRHRLDLAVRLHSTRRGGWHVVRGVVPAAPATALTLQIPLGGTEVRLDSVSDRRSYETRDVDETIATALGADGAVEIQWRPKVQEGRVDPTLTVASEALLDVLEDGLHMVWKVDLDLGRTERDRFTFAVPADYLVEAVDGANVRGWTARPASTEDSPLDSRPAAEQIVDVTLLRVTRGSERCVILLSQRAALAEGQPATIDVPAVRVLDAARHIGVLTIRRSPLLDLRTAQAPGLSRTDAPADIDKLAVLAGEAVVGPLGVRRYQTYRFVATPFVLQLGVSRPADRPEAKVQTVLRVAERQRSLESRIMIHPAGGPVYQVRIVLPEDLRLEQVATGSACEWSVLEVDRRRVLHVYLASGRADPFPIVIHGPLGPAGTVASVDLPRLEVLDAAQQTGEIVVQVDPAFDLQPADLKGCRELELKNVLAWLAAEQRPLARLALAYSTPDYAGVLRLAARSPQIACSTITNVRVTETAIEETILLDFDITGAGLRMVTFVLPAWMKNARITVPMLRERQIVATSAEPDAPVRVTLTLQDEVMGRLRVLVENDRVLTVQPQTAPIPLVETGRTHQRLIALENIGRDEVVVGKLEGVEAMNPYQAEWKVLADYLAGKVGQGYLVTGAAPTMTYQTRERMTVETAGARIGLAQTVLVLDGTGTYRASQSYRVENTTEAFLEVELPDGATLWSAQVAGQPVRPAPVPGGQKPRNVRIPLEKTAPGDLDYVVSLHYGGRIRQPGPFATVDFPVPRTINIAVELSQVRLHLPEEYRWFDFGGTTRQVFDQATLAAGQLRYQTRLAERLTQALQLGSRFSKVRAATNLRTLKDRSEQLGQFAQTLVGNDDLRRELTENTMTVRRAQEHAQQVAPDMQPPASAPGDNREQLYYSFSVQETTRARNQLQGLEYNWDEEMPAEEPQSTVGYNAPGERGEKRKAAQAPATPTPRSQRGALSKEQAQPPQPAGRGGRGGQPQPQAEYLYQQKLQAQQQAAQPPTTPPPATQPTGGRGRGGPPPGQVPARPSDVARSTAATTGPVAGIAPLASLPIEIPVRGKVCYFATPRGDVTITARAISTTTLSALEQAGIVVLIIVLAARGHRFVRAVHGATTARAPGGVELGATLLIVIGVLSVVTGVLPIAGLIVLIAGVVLRRRRRASASAAF